MYMQGNWHGDGEDDMFGDPDNRNKSAARVGNLRRIYDPCIVDPLIIILSIYFTLFIAR